MMINSDENSVQSVRSGEIYRDVYEQRLDERPVIAVARLERGYICNDRIAFATAESEQRALSDGVFALEIPVDLPLDNGDQFAAQFYTGSSKHRYGRFHTVRSDVFGDPLLGFHKRSNQIEQFLLERRFWASHYPPEITALGEALTQLSGVVLRSILNRVGLPQELWAQATGGCVDLAGSYHLTFNHYRSGVAGVGLASHKDDGFITILRTAAEGLEINRAGRWERIKPDPTSFIVNFGLSMEMLTRGCTLPVSAIMHRVTHQTIERSSFGHFTSSACEPGRTVDVFSYARGALRRVCDARELINANDREIYEGTDAPTETTQ